MTEDFLARGNDDLRTRFPAPRDRENSRARLPSHVELGKRTVYSGTVSRDSHRNRLPQSRQHDRNMLHRPEEVFLFVVTRHLRSQRRDDHFCARPRMLLKIQRASPECDAKQHRENREQRESWKTRNERLRDRHDRNTHQQQRSKLQHRDERAPRRGGEIRLSSARSRKRSHRKHESEHSRAPHHAEHERSGEKYRAGDDEHNRRGR